jgi:hypothetical protein
VVDDASALGDQGPVLEANGAGTSAGRTREGVAQALSLLVQQGLKRTTSQAIGGDLCDLLHGVQVDGEVRPVIAESASCDDFSPAGDEVVDVAEFLGCDVALRHL